MDINHHLGALQHGGLPSFDMGIPDEERANHRNIDQHEISLNLAASIRSRRSGGRHLFTEGVEGSKAIFRDCRDFLKQRRDNPIHVSSKINDPRVSKRLGHLPCPRPATNLGKGHQVVEKHEGTGDYEVFRQTRPRSQYGESKEKSHALKEVKKLKAERQAEIPDWNQPGPGPLTRRILDTPLQAKIKKKLGLQLYTRKEDPIEHLNLFESTMAYQMHTDEE
ncbi:hypothetical protein PS2_000928 [Malus domestica]